ncbi:MAG: T9SS type A sorting domain-containing protein [candidate division Zixibacteria bacterium]|nr:T9SS type A sorting domain-containing protein [candidate division Zixibacteria bacterium]
MLLAGFNDNMMAVFKSIDGGDSWGTTHFSGITSRAYEVVIDPVNPDIVYAGGMDYEVEHTYCVIFRTIDGGENWEEIWRDSTEIWVDNITIDPESDNRIYFGTSNGVYRSTNYGDNWIEPSQEISAGSDLLIDPASSSILYASGTDGIFKSGDYGVTWVNIDSSFDFHNVLVIEMDEANRYFYAGTGGGGVYRTNIMTDVDDNSELLPSNTTLYQNYPNPFNSTTNISFMTAIPGLYRIEIINILGQRIDLLQGKQKTPGIVTLRWDASEFSSGMYFYKLTTNNQSLTKRMTLLK